MAQASSRYECFPPHVVATDLSLISRLQPQSTPIGTTSLLSSIQTSSQDYCSTFWNVAMAYPLFNLTQDYNKLLNGGKSSDLKPCVVISLSAKSKM